MFSKLNNLYWFIRYTRIKSVKRRYYRYVAKEKKRLIESGVDVRGVSYFETMKRRKKKQETINGIRFQEKLLKI